MAGEMRIVDLIADIEQGDLILSEFQRGWSGLGTEGAHRKRL
jgi:hypothetical protein